MQNRKCKVNKQDRDLMAVVSDKVKQYNLTAYQLKNDADISSGTADRLTHKNPRGWPKFLYKATRVKLQEWVECADDLYADNVPRETPKPRRRRKKKPSTVEGAQMELPLRPSAYEWKPAQALIGDKTATLKDIEMLREELDDLHHTVGELAMTIVSLQRRSLK